MVDNPQKVSQAHSPPSTLGAAGPRKRSGPIPEGTAVATNPDQDWAKITDLAERRRIQNRIAQRNYRKKLKRRLEDIERRATSADKTRSEGKANTKATIIPASKESVPSVGFNTGDRHYGPYGGDQGLNRSSYSGSSHQWQQEYTNITDYEEAPGLSRSARSTPPTPPLTGFPSPPSNFSLSESWEHVDDGEPSWFELDPYISPQIPQRPSEGLAKPLQTGGSLTLRHVGSKSDEPSCPKAVAAEVTEITKPKPVHTFRSSEARKPNENSSDDAQKPEPRPGWSTEETLRDLNSQDENSPTSSGDDISLEDDSTVDDGFSIADDSEETLDINVEGSLADGEIFDDVMDHAIRSLIDTLMHEFQYLLGQGSQHINSCAADAGAASSTPPQNGDKGSAKNTNGGAKRMVRSGGNKDEQFPHEDENDEHPNKKRKGSSAQDSRALKLACPYYKRNPSIAISHRSCQGPGWETVHRVKEHLYRNHALPIRCGRCHLTFKSEPELTQHLRKTPICDIQEGEVVWGFNKEQERRLRSRKKTGKDEATKWKEVYRILFPEEPEDLIPSPYYTDDQLAELNRIRSEEILRIEHFSRRELPRLVREELERRAHGSIAPVENELRSQLVEIVRDCQSLVFQHYQEREGPCQADHRSPATPQATAKEISLPPPLAPPPPPKPAEFAPSTEEVLYRHYPRINSTPSIHSLVDSGYASTNLISGGGSSSDACLDSDSDPASTGTPEKEQSGHGSSQADVDSMAASSSSLNNLYWPEFPTHEWLYPTANTMSAEQLEWCSLMNEVNAPVHNWADGKYEGI